MSFTKNERIILINQYEIRKKLDPNNADYYDENIEILRSGYEVFYENVDEGVFNPMKESDGDFVLKVLDMYRGIEYYKKTNQDDTEVKDHLMSTFRGFDGNHETKYMAFARFVVHTQQKFTEQLAYTADNDDFNSHMELASEYSAMLDVWMGIEDKLKPTHDQLMSVLNAA